MNPKTLATRVVATGLIALGRARPARNSGIRLLAAAGVLAATGGAFAQAPSRVVLQIHEVVCVDETNSGSIIGEHGNDNMILGGVTIAPNGRKTQIKTVKVGTFQEDGKHKTFSSPMQFASIPVSTGNLREYGMLLVLAEEIAPAAVLTTARPTEERLRWPVRWRRKSPRSWLSVRWNV
jgi:hypothetical protein